MKYNIVILSLEEKIDLAKIISGLDGKVLETKELGEKSLAYPIKKNRSAYHFIVAFDLDKEKLPELQKKLKIDAGILRYLIMKSPKEIIPEEKKPTEIEKAPQPKTEIIKKKPAEIITKPKKTVKKTTPIIKPKPVIKPEAAPAVRPEIEEETLSDDDRLKKLDKKLEELLKE